MNELNLDELEDFHLQVRREIRDAMNRIDGQSDPSSRCSRKAQAIETWFLVCPECGFHETALSSKIFDLSRNFERKDFVKCPKCSAKMLVFKNKE